MKSRFIFFLIFASLIFNQTHEPLLARKTKDRAQKYFQKMDCKVASLGSHKLAVAASLAVGLTAAFGIGYAASHIDRKHRITENWDSLPRFIVYSSVASAASIITNTALLLLENNRIHKHGVSLDWYVLEFFSGNIRHEIRKLSNDPTSKSALKYFKSESNSDWIEKKEILRPWCHKSNLRKECDKKITQGINNIGLKRVGDIDTFVKTYRDGEFLSVNFKNDPELINAGKELIDLSKKFEHYLNLSRILLSMKNIESSQLLKLKTEDGARDYARLNGGKEKAVKELLAHNNAVQESRESLKYFLGLSKNDQSKINTRPYSFEKIKSWLNNVGTRLVRVSNLLETV